MRINPEFFISSARAQSGKPMRFLAAEALTGNWDPTTHTNLGQLIIEGMMFGYLTRAPMRPDNPEEIDLRTGNLADARSTSTRWK